ncbi:hypothetical protein [Oleiharenicola lentus]|uniref:hypothetical protein n=1 Tax=Oleiharenicola lentus TaxID=2508720 RepID=UPI003F66AE81
MKLPLMFVVGLTGSLCAASIVLPSFENQPLDALPSLKLKEMSGKPKLFFKPAPQPENRMRLDPSKLIAGDTAMSDKLVHAPEAGVDYKLIIKAPDGATDYKLIVRETGGDSAAK